MAVGGLVVANAFDHDLAGREGLGIAAIAGEQPAAIGVVARQDGVVRLLQADRPVQVGEGLRPPVAVVGLRLQRTTPARPRYRAGRSGCRSMAWVNRAMAASAWPRFWRTAASAA